MAAMSMRSSDDILKVVATQYEELKAIYPPLLDTNIGFVDEEQDTLDEYFALPNPHMFGVSWSSPYLVSLSDTVAVRRPKSRRSFLETVEWQGDFLARWRSGESFSFPFSDIGHRMRYGWSTGWELDPIEKMPKLPENPIITIIPFPKGFVGLHTEDPVPELISVIEQFTDALSLGYLRFLDFQQLEQQAEQARRERAVERVRAEAMAMRKSDDLLRVVGAMMRGLGEVGIDTEVCFINFVEESQLRTRSYMAAINPRTANISWTSAELIEIDANIVVGETEFLFKNLSKGWIDNWRSGQHWTTEYESDWIHRDIGHFFARVWGLEDVWPFSQRDRSVTFIDVPFSYGTIGVDILHVDVDEEHINIIRQFTEGVELGYIRFLDFQKLEAELEKAHELQMALMPSESPQVEGFDIVGRCLPASQVGGDFFQYFQRNGKRSICMADVTGHAMEAAVPVMMFSGILDTLMGVGDPLENLFDKLNRSMHRNLDSRIFVCFTMGELDLDKSKLRLANGGCPYPYHFHAADGDLRELQADAYPLGVRAETQVSIASTTLRSGDYLVFCSDGIIETGNTDEEIFGFEQTAETIRAGCSEGLSAEALIDRLIGAVQAFAGDEPQGDDMTCVVLRVHEG